MPKTFVVQVTSKGKNPLQWFKEVEAKIQIDLQAKLVELGETAANTMKTVIMSSGYNLSKLADAIDSDFENIGAGVNVRIGNISKFPKTKKGNNTYWEAFNSGFQAGAANSFVPLGSFPDGAPNSDSSGGKWLVGGGKWTFFDNNKSKKIVEPLKFVDIAHDELIVNIEQAVKKIMKEIEQASI